MSEQNKCCACAQKPSEEELMARLDEMIAEYKAKPGGLIPVLQIAQGIFGYLPESALKRDRPGPEQVLQRGRRRGQLLLVLLHRAARQAPGPRLPGHGLLRARRQARARRAQAEAGHRRRRDDAGPAVHAGGGALLRRLRPGAGDHGRRRRSISASSRTRSRRSSTSTGTPVSRDSRKEPEPWPEKINSPEDLEGPAGQGPAPRLDLRTGPKDMRDHRPHGHLRHRRRRRATCSLRLIDELASAHAEQRHAPAVRLRRPLRPGADDDR